MEGISVLKKCGFRLGEARDLNGIVAVSCPLSLDNRLTHSFVVIWQRVEGVARND